MASFRVRVPLSTACTVAPNTSMRMTFMAWRWVSSAPMKMVHLRPRRAAAAAVATPCCPGAGFGDEGCLAHFFGEQGLTERIVHLVGARVEQILTLQPEVEAQFLREVGAESQRRGTAGVVEKQVMEFVLELFGGHDVAHGLIHFQKGRHEQFGYEAAPYSP